MTEHPETPRIAYGDHRANPRAADPIGRLPLAALGWSRRDTHGGYYRIILASAIIAGLIGLFFALSAVFRTAYAWLIAQHTYQISFEEIQVTPPPEWYRGGREAFLKDVKERAGIPKSISVLDLEAERIKAIFVQSPWVENVVRVSRPPLGLHVELQYREPVAQVNVSGDEPYLLDGKATILSRLDVDLKRLEQLGPLIQINGDRLTGPSDPRPGAIWKMKAGVADVARENDRIPQVAKLANFLAAKVKSLANRRSPAQEIHFVYPVDPRGLFLFTGDENSPTRPGSCFFWGKGPGDESPENLSDEDMWTHFQHWCDQAEKPALRSGDYWAFSKEGLRYVRTRPDYHPSPARPPH